MTQLITALDGLSLTEARSLVKKLDAEVEWFKIGKELFTRYGPACVEVVKGEGKKVFLDLKYHDIPNTVAGAVRSASELGVDMLNVHASGGLEMMTAAVETAASEHVLVVAVTVLTSMNEKELENIGIDDPPQSHVVRLAALAHRAGMHGVVCSAWEIDAVREAVKQDEFILVVPGIRPQGTAHGDQRRVMTPLEAHEKGANYIVVGRPVVEAPDPVQAARSINVELTLPDGC
ncbi:MAG: orotidine-5'-phosphate decarboxylase [Lentisphaeria bacterium]